MKNTHLLGVVLAAALATLSTAPLAALVYQTTLSLIPQQIPDLSVDTIIHSWSTDKSTGIVGRSDLIDWSYELRLRGRSLYSEDVVVAGVVQPIGGIINRDVSDLIWIYDYAKPVTQTVNFDNDLKVLQEGGAPGEPLGTGTTYNIWVGVDGDVAHIVKFYGGAPDPPMPPAAPILSTITTPVPIAPAAWLFGSGLLGLIGISRHKKAA